jgi:Alpha/beta hydrolase domain
VEALSVSKVIPLRIPRVDEDGNELGGVPVVLLQAPLGTISAGTSPQAVSTRARCAITRAAGSRSPRRGPSVWVNGDPRLSLEERYGNHAGYVAAVKAAAASALVRGFLLQEDADALIAQAEA